MSVSPFTARLAAAGFLLIGAGITSNLLLLQNATDPATGARSGTSRAGLAMDGERLRRIAMDAISGTIHPTPSEGADPAPAGVRGRDHDGASIARSIGRFAPSSGGLLLQAMPGADPAEARRATIRSVQSELDRRGYAPGTPDGLAGLVTRAAVMAYEHDQGLPITADPSPEVLAHLRHGTAAPGAAVGLDGATSSSIGQASGVIRSVQQSLGQLGYLTGQPDGEMREDTQRAIREFEMDAGLVPSGRISAPLVAKLAVSLNRQHGAAR